MRTNFKPVSLGSGWVLTDEDEVGGELLESPVVVILPSGWGEVAMFGLGTARFEREEGLAFAKRPDVYVPRGFVCESGFLGNWHEQ